MKTCEHCGYRNLYWLYNCEGCGRRLAGSPASDEVGHIDYLLSQVAGWRLRNWITPESANALVAFYDRRKESIQQSQTNAKTPTKPSSVHGATPLPARPAQSQRPSLQVEVLDNDDNRSPMPQGSWMAEFLEAHWLKLLAMLATVFIFAGMRQILGWEWVGTLALALLPLLPISLALGFFYFGMRARNEEAIGAFAYCVVAIGLAGFSVFSVNKHWLGGALGLRESTAAALAVSTFTAAGTLHITRDLRFLHVLLAGFAATLFAALRVVSPSPVLLPTPAWLYGGAFLLLSGSYLVAARIATGLGAPESASVLRAWSILCDAAALARCVLLIGGGAPDMSEAAALLAGGAVLSGLSAQWFPSSGAVYGAGALAGLATALLLRDTFGLDYYAWGSTALGLAVIAIALSIVNRGYDTGHETPGRDAVASAYEQVSLIFAGFAGVTLAGRCAAFLVDAAPSPAGSDWAGGVVMALLCTVAYSIYAVWRDRPALLYASSATTAFGITVCAYRMLREAAPTFVWASSVLIPFAAVALATGLALYVAVDQRESRWSAPILHAAALAIAFGSAASVVMGCVQGPGTSFWISLSSYAALSAVGAIALRDDSRIGESQASAVVALADILAGVAFTGYQLAPASSSISVATGGMALIGGAFVYAMLTIPLRGLDPSHRWLGPLRGIGGCGAIFGMLILLNGEAAIWIACGTAAAFAAFAVMRAGEADALPIAAGAVILVLGVGEFWVSVINSRYSDAASTLLAMLLCAGAAAYYGWIAARSRSEVDARLFTAVIGAIGITSAMAGLNPSGLAFGAACLGIVLLTCGSVLLARFAITFQQPEFGYASAFAVTGAYLRLLCLAAFPDPAWAGLALLPAVAGLMIGSRALKVYAPNLLSFPFWTCAQLLSGAAIFCTVIQATSTGPAAFPYPALTLLCYAVWYGMIGLMESSSAMAGLGFVSVAMLGVGWLLAQGSPHIAWLSAAVIAGCAASAAIYARLALRTENHVFGAATGLAASAAWFELVDRVWKVLAINQAFAMLPFLVGLFAASLLIGGKHGVSLASPLRYCSASLAMLFPVRAIIIGLQHPLDTSSIVTATLAAYSGAFLAASMVERSGPWPMLAALMATAVHGYGLGTIGLEPTVWAAGVVPLAALWLLVARAMERSPAWNHHASAMYGLAATIPAITSAVALPLAGQPGQGTAAVLAMALAAAAYSGLFLMGRGEGFAHAGFAGFLAAYGLILYDHLNLNVGVLDLYLIPIGVYLLLLGNIGGRRGEDETAGRLWWMGLLVTFTPTFSAFYYHFNAGGTPLHALLLVTECVAAITWGIAHRIKAFVFCGALFGLGFAIVLGGGAVVQVWSGLFAVITGVILLAFVFHLSVHEEALRRWILAAGDNWRQWR